MSFRTILAVTAVACLAPLSACAPDSSPESTEEDMTQADALQGDTVYEVTRQDFRKCMWPMCGGVYVKAVNKTKTTCFDGTKQAECYVAGLNLEALGLSSTQTDEVRGGAMGGDVLLSAEYTAVENGFGDFADLLVHKAYDAQTGHDATGTYYLLESSGITCITAPCPSLRARNLNSNNSKLITDVDLSSLGLSEDEQSALMTTVFQSSLIVSGKITTNATSTGTQKLLTVSEYFNTVEPISMLCLDHAACGAGSHCDTSVCLSGCAPGEICAAVCYGQCVPGDAPVCPGGGEICQSLCGDGDIEIPEGCPIPSCNCPIQQPGSCFAACGSSAPDNSCYCDDACENYGDCCSDYATQCL
jgi:hypothetical protein